MSSLDIPSLIPLPDSLEATPRSSTPREPSPDHLADLLTHDIPHPIFPQQPSKSPSSTTPSRPIPIPVPRTPDSPEFGSFVASRTHFDPLGAHALSSFDSPRAELDPIKEAFFDGAHDRVQDRKERVVRELMEHEDEPMYWHARHVITSPEREVLEPPLEHSPPIAVSPPLSDLSRSPSSDNSHPRRLSREERATDPGPSTEATTAEERHAAGKARQYSLSQSPSRYEGLRRTLSRGVTSLFAHPAPSTSPPVIPKLSQLSTSPKPSPPSLASSFSSTLSHNTPFAAHHHPTAPPSGAPGFHEPEFDWDKGNWSSDLSIVDSKRRLATEKVELLGRSFQTAAILTSEVASLIRPFLPPLSRLPRSWSLLYSLDQHGISIHTFYREIARSFELPNPTTGGCVLAVRDARGGVFGVWLGERIRMGGGSYYGSGESFLWKLDKSAKEGEEASIKVFKWTGKNEYVALCEDDYISFGGGDGRTGLYLDSAFDRGYSERCPCFDNEPLCYSGDGLKGRFSCVGLEVWRVGL